MDSVVKISSIHKNKKMITYDLCELENVLLFNYLYYLNNYFEIKPQNQIFLFGKISKLNTIQTIKNTDITNFIEMEFTKFSNNEIDNFLIYSLIYLYMIVIGENASRELCSSLKEILNIIKEKKIWIRKYLEIILNSFIDPRFSGKIYFKFQGKDRSLLDSKLNSQQTVDFNETINYGKRINEISSNQISSFSFFAEFYVMINFLREYDILPTESFLKVMNTILNIESKDLFEDTFEEDDVSHSVLITFKFNKCKCGYQKKEHFINESMNFDEEQDVYLKCKTCNEIDKRTKFIIKIEGHGLDEYFVCEIFSIKKILSLSKCFYKEYTSHFDLKKLNLELLKKITLNLIFYCEKENIRIFLLRCFKSIIRFYQ